MWAEQGLDASQIALKADGTLAASGRTQLADSQHTLLVRDGAGEDAVELSPERFEPMELLGSGGMGDVYLAKQTSLRREVALKQIRTPGASKVTEALLKEAWVGGSLEHPNIVPVHTLARGEHGAAVAMKRVEGLSWTEVIADPSRHERFDDDNPLEAHVRVLMSVCNAVELAHSRGIVHLDLKPDNVMIGRFGEVYVLDWGLSAGLEDGPPWLAKARDIAGIAGTPAYMAPELAAGDGARIDERTDVYLLGGMLHSALTGEPLHGGDTVVSTLTSAYLSKPRAYGADVPAELGSIVHRATHAKPSERFESVERFRLALKGFLDHRRADRLAKTAADRLAELAPLVVEGAGDVEVEPRFAEIELALQRARRSWAEHPQLRWLDDRLGELRVRHALAHERADAAEAFAKRVVALPEELAKEIAALRERLDHRERHVRRLEEMSRELDFTLGSAARRRLFMYFGVVWTLVNLAFGYLTRTRTHLIGYTELLIEGAILVAVLVPVGWFARHTLFANLANRRLYGGLTLTAVTVELHWLVSWLSDVPATIAVGITSVYYFYLFLTLSIVLDKRFWLPSATLAVTVVFVAFLPEYTYEHIGIGGGLAAALILRAWRDGPHMRASETT